MIHLLLAAAVWPVLPDAKLTPGVVRTKSVATICHQRTSTVRNVSIATKHQAYAEYHLADTPGAAEVDHLIALTDGGSNDVHNLWPQKWHNNVNGLDEGAHVKDRLEVKLHSLICSGDITPNQAQYELRANWVKSYREHIGPLPKYPTAERP